MSAASLAPWFALALLCAAFASAVGALTARSLFVTCAHLLAAAGSSVAAILMMGAGDGAVAILVVAVGWGSVLLLAAMLLSARAVKGARGTRPVLGVAAALAVSAAFLWPLADIGATRPIVGGASEGAGFWIAPLLLVVAAACLGLLGYGERGALGGVAQDDRR